MLYTEDEIERMTLTGLMRALLVTEIELSVRRTDTRAFFATHPRIGDHGEEFASLRDAERSAQRCHNLVKHTLAEWLDFIGRDIPLPRSTKPEDIIDFHNATNGAQA